MEEIGSLCCYNRSKFGLLQQSNNKDEVFVCCYNRSKFGLLQREGDSAYNAVRCYNRSKFGLLQLVSEFIPEEKVVITVQNSVFYNTKGA